MEELLVYALLLYEEIVTEESYQNKLHELFLENPEKEILLYLEWETNIKKAIIYIRTHYNYKIYDHQIFGKILIEKLNDYYCSCSDLKQFGYKMYSLWESLPGSIQDEEPFHILSYADDPLSWGDEKQSRKIYEGMLNYYKI